MCPDVPSPGNVPYEPIFSSMHNILATSNRPRVISVHKLPTPESRTGPSKPPFRRAYASGRPSTVQIRTRSSFLHREQVRSMIKDVKDYIGRMNIRGIVDRAVAGRSRASSSTIYDKYFSDVHR